MTRPHCKSLLLLVIWCLIGSLPQWGKCGSWIWLGVLILLAVLFCRRKSAVPALYFAESFPAGLFELEQLHYNGVPLKRTGKDLDLQTFWNKFVQNQKHIDYSEGITVVLLASLCFRDFCRKSGAKCRCRYGSALRTAVSCSPQKSRKCLQL